MAPKKKIAESSEDSIAKSKPKRAKARLQEQKEAVITAAERGEVETVSACLSCGTDVNYKNKVSIL
jgi:hypothetical protein